MKNKARKIVLFFVIFLRLVLLTLLNHGNEFRLDTGRKFNVRKTLCTVNLRLVSKRLL